jgi:hypothetical protein
MSSISNEERLLLKQLAMAAGELLVPPKNKEEMEIREAAQLYFFVDDYSNNIHSFLNICRHFEINPLLIRKILIQVQLGETTNTGFDIMFASEIESARKKETETKTMNQIMEEEDKLLIDLVNRRVRGKLRQNKKGQERNQ